jgi:hypothetical protein
MRDNVIEWTEADVFPRRLCVRYVRMLNNEPAFDFLPATLDDLRKACEAVGLVVGGKEELSRAIRNKDAAYEQLGDMTNRAWDAERMTAQALTVGLAECERLRVEVCDAESRARSRDLEADDLGDIIRQAKDILQDIEGDEGLLDTARRTKDAIAAVCGQRDAAIARLGELNAFHDKVAEIVDAVHHQSMGPLISGTPDEVVAAVRDAVAERNDLRTKLATLTAPMEGEPSDAALAGFLVGNGEDFEDYRAIWRAAGVAKEAPASGENATDQDLSEVWSRYSALLPTSLQAAARRALYDIGKAHGYREGVRANADRDADSRDAALIRAKTDASLRPIEAAIESARLRAEELLSTRDLPRATDEELTGIFLEAREKPESSTLTGGLRAVAERVRRERCLVTRAVEENIDVRFSIHMDGWKIRTSPQTPDAQWKGPDACRYGLKPADVARVLAEMLGEVGR